MDCRSGDNSFFMDGNISARLNAAIPLFPNFVVFQANVGAALWAEGRGRARGDFVRSFAIKTPNFARLGFVLLKKRGLFGFRDRFLPRETG